ncbi:hypothetical protein STRAU_0772 [Streptomyces aurantiacus JA 4570]|uniref:Uncharacterized protein n=1 Tax=Streptomyces aurantiacus JA 4570 TaxID=1286094 RepID=S3ZTS4_9ACTN|nr:hypothetical protein STRAU_0772 [Streptomyces aurantiacus JA 4570]
MGDLSYLRRGHAVAQNVIKHTIAAAALAGLALSALPATTASAVSTPRTTPSAVISTQAPLSALADGDDRGGHDDDRKKAKKSKKSKKAKKTRYLGDDD